MKDEIHSILYRLLRVASGVGIFVMVELVLPLDWELGSLRWQYTIHNALLVAILITVVILVSRSSPGRRDV